MRIPAAPCLQSLGFRRVAVTTNDYCLCARAAWCCCSVGRACALHVLICTTGNNGLSTAECKIQFGMWSMWSAPLLMSNDLKSVSPELKDILQNEEVIAVDQVSKVNLKPNNSLLAVK